MPAIFVDADACPVKNEVYRVAQRYAIPVKVVANSVMRVPEGSGVELVIVCGNPDAADDWIAENVDKDDIVIAEDIPLVSRCLKKGARVLSPKGRVYNEAGVVEAMATRDILTQLRDQGIIGGGPAPFQAKDRSLFLQRLDAMIQSILRQG